MLFFDAVMNRLHAFQHLRGIRKLREALHLLDEGPLKRFIRGSRRIRKRFRVIQKNGAIPFRRPLHLPDHFANRLRVQLIEAVLAESRFLKNAHHEAAFLVVRGAQRHSARLDPPGHPRHISAQHGYIREVPAQPLNQFFQKFFLTQQVRRSIQFQSHFLRHSANQLLLIITHAPRCCRTASPRRAERSILGLDLIAPTKNDPRGRRSEAPAFALRIKP